MGSELSHAEFWIPAFSRPSMDVSLIDLLPQAEASSALAWVWLAPDSHGQQRLFRITTADEIDLSMLLRPVHGEHEANARWQQPPAYTPLPTRIAGMMVDPALLPPTPFLAEQSSIGNQAGDLLALSPDGQPGGGGLGEKLSRMFRQSLDRLINKLNQANKKDNLGGKTPSASPVSTRGTGGGLVPMAMLRKLEAMLNSQREKQIQKLLGLMKRDPDLAMRYAPPMSHLGAPRGLARSGSRLGLNSMDFSLSKLFGGGMAVDPWQLNYRLQLQLMEAYREQASREAAAGRFRRAAYIYAHLIGDLGSAANMLEHGKFYLEAAKLYERLKRSTDMARCLRLGGQLAEAAQLYEQLEDFDTAADLWLTLGNAVAAKRTYERALADAYQRHNILKASQIADIKLKDPTRAEELLWSQWPHGHQIVECMKSAFKRLADQARHAEAHCRFEKLVELAGPSEQTMLARVSAELHRYYPDARLRAQAEDQCRISVAHHLRVVSASELSQRLNILQNLHPDDLMLQRDTRRFERALAQSELKLLPATIKGAKRRPLLSLPGCQLPAGQYIAAMMIDQELFAVWKTPNRINCGRIVQLLDHEPFVEQCGWHAEYAEDRSAYCHYQRGTNPLQIYVSSGAWSANKSVLTSPQGGNEWNVYWYASDDGGNAGLSDDGSFPVWDPQSQCLIVLKASTGNIQEQIHFDEFLRTCQAEKEYLLQVAGESIPTWTPHPDCAVLLENRTYISHGHQIVCAYQKKPYELAWLPEPVRWMVPAPPMSEARLLVATTNTLMVVSIDRRERPEKIAEDEAFSTGAFLAGGRIVATTATELILFRRTADAYVQLARLPLDDNKTVLRILSLDPEHVGLLYTDGYLQRWRVQ